MNWPNECFYEGKPGVAAAFGLTNGALSEVTAVLLFAELGTLDLARCGRLRWVPLPPRMER